MLCVSSDKQVCTRRIEQERKKPVTKKKEHTEQEKKKPVTKKKEHTRPEVPKVIDTSDAGRRIEQEEKGKQQQGVLAGKQLAVATRAFLPDASASGKLSFQTGDIIMLDLSRTGNGLVMGCKLGKEEPPGWCLLSYLKKFDIENIKGAELYAGTLTRQEKKKEKVLYGGLDLSSIPEQVELIKSRTSQSGFKGVTENRSGTWKVKARIEKGGGEKVIGSYNTKEEAALVYARIALYFKKYGKISARTG